MYVPYHSMNLEINSGNYTGIYMYNAVQYFNFKFTLALIHE